MQALNPWLPEALDVDPRREDDSQRLTLAGLPTKATGRITSVRVGADLEAWLAAVGIAQGELVTVLRRAPFGGPLHLRTGSGGEFAIDSRLAAGIDVRVPLRHEPRP